jgi:hypothetical protein
LLRLCFDHNEISNQKKLAGKYKVYRCSLANNKQITEEWLIIEPVDGSSHSMNVTIHNYPASGAPKEQFEGVLFQVDESHHAIVSSKASAPNRVRFLLFGVPQAMEEPVILYGLLLGISLNDRGNPVATCFVAGNVLPASPLTELERRHITRIDQDVRVPAPLALEARKITVPAGWDQVPMVDEVIKKMISNNEILRTDNSVLRADQAIAQRAKVHFRKVKAWYEANSPAPTG